MLDDFRWLGTRVLRYGILGAVGLLLAFGAVAEETGEGEERGLPDRYERWLEEVELLLSDAEREVFESLEADYQRDHFIRRFWKVRDPFEQTPRNEFQELWELRAQQARQAFEDLRSERAQAMLQFGEPSRRKQLLCTDLLQPLEVWEYDDGNERIRGYFTLVFIGFQSFGRGPHRAWQPHDGLRRLLGAGVVTGSTDGQLARRILRDCTRGDEILSALAQTLDLTRVEAGGGLLPRPDDEWVRAFEARSTALPEDAELLSGALEVTFPGRHQSRTVVQGLVSVPKDELELAELGKHRSYQLLVDGEILRKGELFDHFRYRFNYPAELASDEVPVVVERFLRPGDYELILKVEDVESKRAFRVERELDVPRVERRKVEVASKDLVATPAALAAAKSLEPDALAPMRDGGLDNGVPGPGRLGLVSRRLDEANASIATGDHVIQILDLPEVLTVGKLRVLARARGEGIARVAFELDGRPVMKKSRPPYSVEIDLGDKPRVHRLRVAALDDGGRELASDEVLVNAGPHSFSVRLLEPRSGKPYRTSVRAHAEVEVPEGEKLEKVELYLNETLVATLYQPPFELPMLLPEGEEVTYVRAVAYLEGGNAAEDVQFINAPDFIDELDVQFVELFTTITDRRGHFVEDIAREDFSVYEDGELQAVRRFETMKDLPMRTGLVLDTSLSMLGDLHHVRNAAYRFFEQVLTPRDRAALVSFNNEPQLLVRFTNDKEILAGGLAGLTAEGETALYDALIFSLHYFSGLKGKRALIVLTDGEDTQSGYNYDDAIDFARRTGVAVYVIGLGLATKDSDVRLRMRQLAAETGGELYLINSASQLSRVYDSIQEELRSQYLIAYQSSQQNGDGEFRRVEVKMHRKGCEAKTIRGYFP